MLKFIIKLLNLLIARSENYNQRRQNSANKIYQDQHRASENSIFKYKDNSLQTKRNYIGPLFENKPSTINYNKVQDTKPESVNDNQRFEPLRLEIKMPQKHNKSILARSSQNTALDYTDMINPEIDRANRIEDVSRPKKKGSNATVVVFIILLIIVGNLFPSAFRGVQFFFVAIILFFISFFITSRFEK